MLNLLNPILQPFTNRLLLKSASGHAVQGLEQDHLKHIGLQPDGPVRQGEAISLTGTPSPSGGIVLALNDLKSMAQTLFQRVQKKASNVSLTLDDPDLTLKKLILARLMNNGRLPETKGSIEMRPSMTPSSPEQGIAVESASYLSLDISIGFQDRVAIDGKARISDQAVLIHLEYLSYSAVSVGYNGHGLNLLAPNLVDTGRYLIGFKNEMTVEIYEKFSKLSTVVWGDPHVDLSDVEGSVNGEFSDLKRSDLFTVFELQDGTKVLFTAPDSGVIQSVDILKNKEWLHAVGGGAQGGTEARGVFFRSTASKDMDALESLLRQADWIKAGGDGNDWYDLSGKLVWGNVPHD